MSKLTTNDDIKRTKELNYYDKRNARAKMEYETWKKMSWFSKLITWLLGGGFSKWD